MTEYDLETKKALRRVSLLEYGFGPEILRGRKICPACGRGNGAYRTACISCGAALPKETLYDFLSLIHISGIRASSRLSRNRQAQYRAVIPLGDT